MTASFCAWQPAGSVTSYRRFDLKIVIRSAFDSHNLPVRVPLRKALADLLGGFVSNLVAINHTNSSSYLILATSAYF